MGACLHGGMGVEVHWGMVVWGCMGGLDWGGRGGAAPVKLPFARHKKMKIDIGERKHAIRSRRLREDDIMTAWFANSSPEMVLSCLNEDIKI